MSYLARIASRASGLTPGGSAASPVGRPAPAMRIDSPIVAADQRLGLPEFAGLLSLDSSPATPVGDALSEPFAEPTPGFAAGRGAEPRTAPWSLPKDARSEPATEAGRQSSGAREDLSASSSAFQSNARPGVAEPAPRVAAPAQRATAAESDSAVLGRPPLAGPALRPVSPAEPAQSLTTAQSLAAAKSFKATETVKAVETVQAVEASSAPRLAPQTEQRAAHATRSLAAAMAELNSWLSSGPSSASVAASSSAPTSGEFSRQVSEPPPAPPTWTTPLQARAEAALLSARPTLPSPASAPAEAAGPVIHIGRIEVEVVAPPPPAPSRGPSAAAQRASRSARAPGFAPPQRAFGWRQR